MKMRGLLTLLMVITLTGVWSVPSFGGQEYILAHGSRLCDDSGRFCFDGYISRYAQRQIVIEIKGRVAKGCDPGKVIFILVGENKGGAKFRKEVTVDIKGSYGEIIDKKVGIGRGISADWRVEKVVYLPKGE